LRLNQEKKRFLDGIKVFACNLRAEMGWSLAKTPLVADSPAPVEPD
jgi:hypothetical protein